MNALFCYLLALGNLALLGFALYYYRWPVKLKKGRVVRVGRVDEINSTNARYAVRDWYIDDSNGAIYLQQIRGKVYFYGYSIDELKEIAANPKEWEIVEISD